MTTASVTHQSKTTRRKGGFYLASGRSLRRALRAAESRYRLRPQVLIAFDRASGGPPGGKVAFSSTLAWKVRAREKG